MPYGGCMSGGGGQRCPGGGGALATEALALGSVGKETEQRYNEDI